MHWSCPSVCLSVCRQNAKTRFSQKLSNLELWCLFSYRKLCKLNWAFQIRTHYCIPTIPDGWDPPSWQSTWRHFFCRGWSDLDKISETGGEWHADYSDMSKSKPDVEFQYGGRLGEINGMSSQSHVSHCRVLPRGEFTVTIPEPHATLPGVRIPSAILKIVFAIFYFFVLFLMQFRLWRAGAFVSSPIHLFDMI